MNRIAVLATISILAVAGGGTAAFAQSPSGSVEHRLSFASGDDHHARHVEAGDDRGHDARAHPRREDRGTHRHVEPGDDHGTHLEPGDDHGSHVEPGDDHGTHVEPGDDHGTHAEPGDDHGGDRRGSDDGRRGGDDRGGDDHGGHGSDD